MAGSIIPQNSPELHLGPEGACLQKSTLVGWPGDWRGAWGREERQPESLSSADRAEVLRDSVPSAGLLTTRVGPGQVQQVTTRGSARNMDKKNEGEKLTAPPQLEL